MKYPTTRFVFNRKNTASRKVAALIQVEVLLSPKKKYISTGVKVYKDQWNEKLHVCNTNEADVLNARILQVKSSIDTYIHDTACSGIEWDWDAFSRYLASSATKNESFIAYIERRISERTDIRPSTAKSHRKIVASLTEYGRIVTFSELTKANITGYYEWLLGRDIEKIGSDGLVQKQKMSVSSAWGYMKILRTYIHDAIAHEVIDSDPSVGIKVRRGEKEQTRWLTEEEVKAIEEAKLSSGSLVRVRDLFIFSCNCGLAYSDLMDFKAEKIERNGDDEYLYGHRIKTGQEYVVLILPKAKEILEKYNYKLPKYSNQQYNKRLKDMAREAGVDEPLSSHWGRITAGFMALNMGVRIEVVSKMLGHSTISETQRTYSRILKRTVVAEMKSMTKKSGE